MTTEANIDETVIPAQAHPSQDKNLDMVRNILFGEQVKENEKRLANLERFVKVWTNSVRDEVRKNLDNINTEIRLLHDLLEQESKTRIDNAATARKHFEQRGKEIDKLTQNVSRVETTLTQRIDDDVDALTQSIKEQRDELLDQVQHAVAQLRQDKTDRKTLANMLHNISRQLEEAE